MRYRQALDWDALSPLPSIDPAAFPIPFKRLPRGDLVTVHLPEADCLVVVPVIQKALDILRRIAQEEPDLMRELLPALKPPQQMPKAA